MSRETKEIITPAGNKVVVYTYLTGGEAEQLEDIFFEESNVDVESGNKVKINTAKAIRRGVHKTIEILVVSVDGSTDKILDIILGLKKEDYKFIVDAINEVSGGDVEGKKK